MDLKFFEKLGVTAGFTQVPDLAEDRRNAMATAARVMGTYVVRPKLVHGTNIVCITRQYIEGTRKLPAYFEIPDTDGTVTNMSGVILTSTHADCIPVYTCDPVKGIVGLAHAGWKGTAGAIAEKLVAAMTELGSNPCDVHAYIGPGIGRCHFEVSDDVKLQFEEQLPWCTPFIDKCETPGKYMIDLKGINAESLKRAGVSSENIEISPICTYCDEEGCWSYRRNGTANRMLAYIKK